MSYNKNIWKKGDKITAEKLNNIEQGVENASQNGTSGGGSDLPTPGTAGNVLISTGAAWISAQSGLYVSVTKNGDDYERPSASAGEIYAAVSNGRPVFLDVGNTTLPLVQASYIDGSYFAVFGFDVEEGKFIGVSIYDNEGTPVAMDGDINFGTVLPTPDEHGADNGKVLGVDDGAYALVDILPPYSVSEAGYILKVNASGTGLEWVAP